MATTPLVVTAEVANQATRVANNAVRVLKATAVDGGGAVVAQSLAGFDDPETDISGVEKLVKAVAVGTTSEALVNDFNVLNYGAVGDGVTDDTAAIQAAIDAAHAIGGGAVLLNAGTYRLSSTLVLKRGVALVGLGRSRTGQQTLVTTGTILKPLSNYGDVIRIEAAAHGCSIVDIAVHYPGITLSSTSTPSTKAAVIFTVATVNAEFTEGVTIKGMSVVGMGQGIRMPWVANTSVNYAQYYYCSLQDLHFARCNAGLVLNGMSDIRVSDVHCDVLFGMNLATIEPKTAPIVNNVALAANTWSATACNLINDLGNSVVHKLECYSCGGDSIVLQDCVSLSMDAGTTASSGRHGLVVAGAINGSRVITHRSALNGGSGIYLTSSDQVNLVDLTVSLSRIENNYQHGVSGAPTTGRVIQRIRFDATDVVSNGLSAANTYDGINLNASEVVILGGALADYSISPTQRRAFDANFAGADKWTLNGVLISGNTASIPFSLAGKNLDISACPGLTGKGLSVATPAIPGGLGASFKVTNLYGYPVWVYHTGGLGVAITDRTTGPIAIGSPNPVLLRHGEAIQFDTTLPSAWRWFGI